MRVLLADDDPNVHSALSLMLKQESHITVDEVTSSSDLLGRMRKYSPDVVLLDWELPGSGPELISLLHDCQPHLMVLALSSQPEARKPALAAGADYFISKGEPPEQLLSVISRCRASKKAIPCSD